jgi:ectoine hydroxylase-related dioxygenase (phytanoyl-CoA dioxygenase family)
MLNAMKLHPRNERFEWCQPEPPYDLVCDAQARDYRELGGFVLEDAFSAQEIRGVLDVLDPIEAESNAYLQAHRDGRASIARADEIIFRPHIVKQDPTAKAFAGHPVLRRLCRDLIGPSVRLYWDQLVYKHPETPREFPWHQDNGYTYVEPQQYLTCWVALTDATTANGCPWIAPGFHTLGTLDHRWTELGFECLDETPNNALPLELSAGSIAVFSSLTPHRTGPNTTDAVRKAYILQYAADGAVVHPLEGPPVPANDPDRQFFVVGP